MTMRRCTFTLGTGLLAAFLVWRSARAADWPQFRGPNHDGGSAKRGWLEKWPDGGPKVLWKANVGQGYSGVAISGGQLFTMGHVKPSAADSAQEDADLVSISAVVHPREAKTVSRRRRASTRTGSSDRSCRPILRVGGVTTPWMRLRRLGRAETDSEKESR